MLKYISAKIILRDAPVARPQRRTAYQGSSVALAISRSLRTSYHLTWLGTCVVQVTSCTAKVDALKRYIASVQANALLLLSAVGVAHV